MFDSKATSVWKDYAGTFKTQKYIILIYEDPTDLAQLADPKLALSSLKDLVIIDEIQRRPEISPYFWVLVDRQPIQLLILGSTSHALIQRSLETLARRIKYIALRPFTYQ